MSKQNDIASESSPDLLVKIGELFNNFKTDIDCRLTTLQDAVETLKDTVVAVDDKVTKLQGFVNLKFEALEKRANETDEFLAMDANDLGFFKYSLHSILLSTTNIYYF
jgi:hypothetical protein